MALVQPPAQININVNLDQFPQDSVHLKSGYFPHWSLHSHSEPSSTLKKNIFPYIQSGFPLAAFHCALLGRFWTPSSLQPPLGS